MAAATYSTDLALIDDAQDVTSYTGTGGGASAVNDETDYFINDAQCISKNGFTAVQKGIIHDDVSAPSITAGDAVFIWGRQANRNIMDTIANSGGSVIMGTSNAAFAGFNVDGNNVVGSNLLSWVNYAVDPTQTSSYSSGSPGSPSGWDHFGMEWTIGSSGSLKGAPNAVGVIRHGRELRVVDGDLGNGFATFDAAAVFDAGITRRWGILTPVTGGYLFHGAFVMGQSGTSTDFRDANRSIQVAEDPFLPSTFNEFIIENSSSNVEWAAIQISALGTTAPFILTLNVGTFTGDLCRFTGAGTSTFASTGAMTNSTWKDCDQVLPNEADLSGSSFLTPIVAADSAAVSWAETISSTHTISELDNTIFEMGTNNHHAVSFTTGVSNGADITLTGIEFTGFDADGTGDSDNSILEFLATTGTITVNLVGCTVDGVAASSSNFTVDERAGCTVNVNYDPKTVLINVTDTEDPAGDIENARVFLETAATAVGGEAFEVGVTTLTQAAGTATCTCSAVHGLETGDKAVIRGAQPDNYNRVVTVTVTSTTVFTYPVDSGVSSPATGTPLVSYVAIHGLTNASGDISVSRTFGADQAFKGWARKKNAVSPFFADGNLSFTVDSANGNTVNVTLQPDE